MKNSHQKGSAPIIITIIIVILLIIGGIYWYTKNKSAAPVAQNPQTTADPATPQPAGTTTQATITETPTENIKTYQNSTFGFSFTYPTDFLLKSEKFTKNNEWIAEFSTDRGTINVTIAKNLVNNQPTRLNSRTVSVGGKNALVYDTRLDVCDATFAETELDTEYRIQWSFKGCGGALGSIFKDQGDISKILASIAFTNQNSQLLIDQKTGIAFRYPITLNNPVITTASNVTTFNFGNNVKITSGPNYNSVLKKNVTVREQSLLQSSEEGATEQFITINGKTAYKVTIPPVSGAKTTTVYVANKSDTDILAISETAVDSANLDLIVSSLGFIK